MKLKIKVLQEDNIFVAYLFTNEKNKTFICSGDDPYKVLSFAKDVIERTTNQMLDQMKNYSIPNIKYKRSY